MSTRHIEDAFTTDERTELAGLVSPRTLSFVIGTLVAIASMPTNSIASGWLDDVLDVSVDRDRADTCRIEKCLLRLHNFVSRALLERDVESICPDGNDGQACHDFCESYLRACQECGFALEDGDKTAECLDLMLRFSCIYNLSQKHEFSGGAEGASEVRAGMRRALPGLVNTLYAAWERERRATTIHLPVQAAGST